MKKLKNKVTEILGLDFPIIQAGMVWTSGHKLASACCQSGILGVVGAGSLSPELLRHHLEQLKKSTNRPFAVNIPLLYHKVEQQIEVALAAKTPIFITSAGSPKKYTSLLKKEGVVVIHVTSSPQLAIKCQDAGVDMVIAEGFEAGGHNGREEITTLVLIPQVVDAVNIPVIAAGGIADGRAMVAVEALGASGFQLGSRFLACRESSAHPKFKELVTQSQSGDTTLAMKSLVPVRLLKNAFARQIEEAEKRGANVEELSKILGRGRAKAGIFEGDLEQGELEIGQVTGLLRDLPSAKELVSRLRQDYWSCKQTLCAMAPELKTGAN